MADHEICRSFTKTIGTLFQFQSNVGIMDSVNSTTFIKRPPYMTDTQEKFLYTKELLTSRIFLGCYHERRHVPVLKEYRDVVIISSEETDLHKDLDKLVKKWTRVREIKWVGITGPDTVGLPKAYCFWVKLTNLAFGEYWFQIKHVKLVQDEIILQLKYIRRSQAPLVAVTPQVTSKPTSVSKNEATEASTSVYSSGDQTAEFDWMKTIKSFQETITDTVHFVQPYLTFRNAFALLRLMCALVIVLIVGFISLIGHLGEYILKLLREFTLLVNAFTPIVVQIIDFLSKIVGGILILLAGMFCRKTTRFHQHPHENHNIYSIPYSSVSSNQNQMPPVDWRERNRTLRQELFLDSVKRK